MGSRNDDSTASAVEAFKRGFQAVPIHDGGKRPHGAAWTHIHWDSEEQVTASFDSWRKEGASGIGLLLGTPSDGLVDVDLDHPRTLRMRDYFLPPTPMKTGRAGRPRSHYWYRVTENLPSTRRYKMPDSSVSVEIRGTGSQTVIPPSIHPSGEKYRWEGTAWGGKKGPAEVDGPKLAIQVALLGLGAVLLDNWPERGSRHEAYLALAGGLLRYGDGVHPFWEKNLHVLIGALADATHDDDGPDARVAEVMGTTITRLREPNGKVAGFPTLAKLIGIDHAELARRMAREVESLGGFTPGQTTDLLAGPGAMDSPMISTLPPETRNPMEERINSWAAVDLEPYLSGQVVMPAPSVLIREDGQGLMYPGRVNSLFGLSEAQPYSATVWTPAGPRNMGDLQIGDEVLGLNGLRTRVTDITERGVREVLEVVTGSGIVIECDAEHLWSVRRTASSTWHTKRTHELVGDLREKSKQAPKWHLPQPLPVEFDHCGDLAVAPYTLGALIGDGGLTKGVTLHAEDPEIIERVAAENPGVQPKPITGRGGGVYLTTARGKENPLLTAMRKVNLIGFKSSEKFIPASYLIASVQDRLALLQGLMDTDGTMDGKRATLTTVSPRLADGVEQLVRSLGGISSRKTHKSMLNGQEHLPSYKISVRLPLSMCPFFLSRKAERYRLRATHNEPHQSIREIRSTGRVEAMRCIQVDSPLSLYLTKGFVATHNSAKSWISLFACTQEMSKGDRVIYIDLEDEPAGTLGRIMALGAAADDIKNQFRYVHPEGPLADMQRYRFGTAATDEGKAASAVFRALLESFDPTLVVADGMTVLYGLHGHDTNEATATDVITQWLKGMCRGGRTTVIVIDHTGKGGGVGASPIGAHHKVAMVQGTALRADVMARPMPGAVGRIRLVVFKDRPGVVRSFSTKDEEQIAGIVNMDSRDEGITRMSIEVPDAQEVLIGNSTAMEEKLASLARASELQDQILALFGGDLDLRLTTAEVIAKCGASQGDVYAAWGLMKQTGMVVQEGSTRWTKFRLTDPTGKTKSED